MKDLEHNPQVEWKKRRKKILRCSYCAPNRGENTKRRCKHKLRSWKLKKPKQYGIIRKLS